MFNYESRIEKAKKVIGEADYILIGAGAGLSTAAGLEYSGDKFKNNFGDFIDKYHFTDLYTATFYDFESQEEKWLKDTKDCKIPSEEVMYCPVCNEEMDVNLRKDAYFVEDDYWYKQSNKYSEFIDKIKGKKVALIEIGVGFNTPGIIRFPFEQLVKENESYSLIRINKEHPESWNDLGNNLIAFNEDTNKIIEDLKK